MLQVDHLFCKAIIDMGHWSDNQLYWIWWFQQPSRYSETLQGSILRWYICKDWGSLHWWWTLWQCHPIHTRQPHLSLSSSSQVQVYLKHQEKSNKERQNCLYPKDYCRRKRTSCWDEHPSHFHETWPSKISMDVLSQDARVQVGGCEPPGWWLMLST